MSIPLEKIIENCRSTHGDRYEYNLINEGIRVKTQKLQIICPVHGVFSQWYGHHVKGFGCPSCSGKAKKNTEIFIREAREVHGDKYDYSLVEYKNVNTPVTILCPLHGKFRKTYTAHITEKQGCRKCSGLYGCTNEEFIQACKTTHSDMYDYSKTLYKGMDKRVSIICKSCLEEFTPKAKDHYHNKSGCPFCKGVGGFTRTSFVDLCKNKNRVPSLYVLFCKDNGEKFFKVGITSRSVKDRYKTKLSLPYPYRVLYNIKATPEEIYDKERHLCKLLKNYRYTPKVFFDGSIRETFIASKETLKIIKENILI